MISTEKRKVELIETDVKCCRFCGKVMEENEDRKKHEDKCGKAEDAFDYRSLNAGSSTRNLHDRDLAADSINIELTIENKTWKKLDDYKRTLRASNGEIVRSALLDWFMNPEKIDDGLGSLSKPRGMTVRVSTVLLSWIDAVTRNRSALVRAAIDRYIDKIEGIESWQNIKS